ncbi:MAG: hypothetical protein CVV52_04000 [Spirochaetae bacterium HGW-Spirochaetae-8]|nr:MAG: hypothetical protein CVV52_04000 [Spirochaetae bacterium HGW-Spirochaetae-8]
MRKRTRLLLSMVLLFVVFSVQQVYSANDLDAFVAKVDTVKAEYGKLVEEYQKIMQKSVTEIQSSEIGRVLEGFVGVKTGFDSCITLAGPLRDAIFSNRSGVIDQLKTVTNVLLKDRLEAIIKGLDAQVVILDNGIALARSSLDEIPEYMNTLSIYRDALGFLVSPGTNAVSIDSNMTQNDIPAGSGQTAGLAVVSPIKVPKVYKIGDEGPAGGKVFYDKGGYSDGWRYMEAAPLFYEQVTTWGGSYSLTNLYGKQFFYKVDVPLTFTVLGSGNENTIRIVTAYQRAEKNFESAAELCSRMTIKKDGVQYDDWFLPSLDELNQMYSTLKKMNLGDFADDYYWSSSASSADTAWSQNFKDGIQIRDSSKGNHIRIRAVRAF